MTLRFQAPRFSLRMDNPLALPPALQLAGLVAALTIGLSGCDSSVCVFGGTCNPTLGPGSGDTDSLGSDSGALPSTGSFLELEAPEFLGAAPTGDFAVPAHAETPIFVEFSESLNPASLLDVSDPANPINAFQMIATISGQEVPLLPPALVGDGRVVVILPVVDYIELQNFQLFFREGQRIADLSGQLLGDDFTSAIVDITIDSESVDGPSVIYSFPGDGSLNNGDTSEIVIGFDRPMDGTTVDTGSFAVTVDGAEPPINPQPEPITVLSTGGSTPATQVFTWTPIDDDGVLQSYGIDADVFVRLSDTPDEIVSLDGLPLPLTETAFRTNDFTLPLAAAKPLGVRPEGGFGRADVFGTDAIVNVTLSEEPPGGTEAEFYLFGQSPQDSLFLRTSLATVTVPSGVTEFSVTGKELGLFDNDGDVRFADGEVQVAVVLRNGLARSAARLFDADPSTIAIETPIFDTTPPVLLGLGASGDATDSFFGDVRDFAAFGRANEPIAFAFVDAGGDTNGGTLADPPLTAFSTLTPDESEAYFIASPVQVGVVDPNAAPLAYEVTIFDAAFNSSTESVTGTFTQRGVVGPGGAPTGSTVNVRVFDAGTLAPVENALVLSYQELSGGITFVDDALTVGGAASVAGAGAGSTIITVDAEGFDLFSFQGVPRDAVDILLDPIQGELSSVSGRVIGTIDGGLVLADRLVQDTRTELPQRLFETGTCGTLADLSGFQCLFEDVTVRPGRLGALTVLGVDNSLQLTPLTASLYLTNFALGAPLAPVGVASELADVTVDAGAGLFLMASDDAPQFFGLTTFDVSRVNGLGALADDPTVTVDGTAAGLGGALLIGAGQSSETGTPGIFGVVAAVAGAAAPGGSLEAGGALSPESFLRMRAVDIDSNETVARPRLSNIGSAAVPMDIPVVTNPVAGSMTGGPVYNIQVADVLPDSAGLNFGLYRVRLTDTLGRGWTLVALDTLDSAGNSIVLSVQNIAAQGGTGLQNGEITASVEVFGQNLDRGEFLWTDLEREHELYSRAAPITFTQN